MEQESQSVRPKLISIENLFRDTFLLYRNRFGVFASIMAVPTVLSLAGVFVKTGVGATIVLIILTILANIFAGVALTVAAVRGGEPVGIYRTAWSLILPYAWVVALTSLVNIGGIVMGMIPAIIFANWFLFAPFIFVDKGLRGMEAILRSKEYVRGYWWPIFGRLVLVSILIGLFSMLLSFVMGNLGEFTHSNIAAAPMYIFLFFLIPFIIAYDCVLYRSVKEIKPNVEAAEVSKKGKYFFIFSAVLGVAVPILLLAAIAAGYFASLTPPVISGDAANQEAAASDVK